MTSYISSAILASLILISLSTTANAEKAVTFDGAIQPTVGAEANQFTVTVQLDIKDGWHTCAEAGEGAEEPTALEMKLPEGVKAIGDWNRPAGIAGKELNSEIYVGQVSFSKGVVVDPDAYGKSIEVVVSYQACTDESCNPPQTETVSIAIPKKDSSGSSIFESHVCLEVDGVPLNKAAKTRFPSPGIFDVDDDGKAELVIGSLMGSVNVYENLNNSGSGDPVWGSRKSLKNAKGRQIRTSNW